MRQPVALLVLLVALTAAAATAASAPRPSDRSIKLDLIAKLTQGPQILILGDSRGREAEPSFVQRLTGHTGFNASVMGGSTPEFWVFTRYTADRFPNQKRRYIWFVSSGLMADIPSGFTEGLRAFIATFSDTLGEIDKVLTRNAIWAGRTQGVGVLTPAEAVNHSLSGPMLRASAPPRAEAVSSGKNLNTPNKSAAAQASR